MSKILGGSEMDKYREGYLNYPINNWEEYLALTKSRFQADYPKKRIGNEYTMDDFKRIITLGTGAFGRVFLVKRIGSEERFALKVLEKASIVKNKQLEHTLQEKRILQSIRFPFTIHMEFFFMDNSYLYMGMQFIQGGEMFNHLRNQGKFPEILSKFYAAQVLLVIEYFHNLEVIYRDLKPENILIDRDGYIKVTDMGFCKVIKGRTYTLCGTPDYLAPEVLMNKGYGFSADWWSLGVLIYEMTAGFPPFYAQDPMQTYEKIVIGKYSMPKAFSPEIRDLLKSLIQIDFTRRFGCMKRGVNDIKDHPFFSSISWLELLNKRIASPFKPKLRGMSDTTNFERIQEVNLHTSSKDKYVKEFLDF